MALAILVGSLATQVIGLDNALEPGALCHVGKRAGRKSVDVIKRMDLSEVIQGLDVHHAGAIRRLENQDGVGCQQGTQSLQHWQRLVEVFKHLKQRQGMKRPKTGDILDRRQYLDAGMRPSPFRSIDAKGLEAEQRAHAKELAVATSKVQDPGNT